MRRHAKGRPAAATLLAAALLAGCHRPAPASSAARNDAGDVDVIDTSPDGATAPANADADGKVRE